jgi:hypothetical protein
LERLRNFSHEKYQDSHGIPGDIGNSDFDSDLRDGLKQFDIEACVTVELLLLDPPELFVAVVREVDVEITEGDVSRDRAAARTAL